MDAVAAVYRLAPSLSPGMIRSSLTVEFHRRGRFDATITLHDGRSFGVIRQSLAVRRRVEMPCAKMGYLQLRASFGPHHPRISQSPVSIVYREVDSCGDGNSRRGDSS